MMTDREILRLAQRGAYEIREKAGYCLLEPFPVIDAAEQLNVTVLLVGLPSFEGIYCHEKRTILLSALRPIGRRAFTCAHELGHWHFGHGTTVDELQADIEIVETSEEERLANAFAQYLLMPPPAVKSALTERGWSPSSLTPEKCFVLSSQFGVAYSAFVTNLQHNVLKLEWTHYNSLRKVEPKNIRARLLGTDSYPHLVVLDEAWNGRSIDIEVGDALLISGAVEPSDQTLGKDPACTIPGTTLLRADAPGVSTIDAGGKSAHVKISKRGSPCLARYRHHNN